MRATIQTQPQGRSVRLSSLTNVVAANLTFSVSVLGSPPISYQWVFNGTDISGATGSNYTLTSVSFSSLGSYWVKVTDAIGSLVSDPAILGILIAPAVVQPLPSQPITLLQRDSISYTVSVSGLPPPFNYSWRRTQGGVTTVVTNLTLNSTNSTLALANLQPSNSGLYRVVITNTASLTTGAPANSTNTLTVLADSDGDGLPDAWEILYGLNPNDPTDAKLDKDGDGLTNLQEYIAGTDPTDPLSYLKIDRLASGLGPTTVQFTALSNKTYSLQYKESPAAGRWTKFADVNASPSNRVEAVLDPFPPTATRLYRLATPHLPDPTTPAPFVLTSPRSVVAAVGDAAVFD